jgi:CheY-like chemotaxis protein
MFAVLFFFTNLLAGFGLYFVALGAALLLPLLALPVIGYYLFEQLLKDPASANVTANAEIPATSVQSEASNFIPLSPAPIMSVDSEIEEIRDYQIPELLEHLPYDGWHNAAFHQENDCWRFSFKFNSRRGRFATTALGKTPTEAFTLAKQILHNRIEQWQKIRFEHALPSHALKFTGDLGLQKIPKVLIVDDDVDLALAMQAALRQFGCQTEVATTHEDLHHKISFGDMDLILLDWMLDDHTTADNVVEKSVRLINTFSDLRHRFSESRPRVVTYSALDAKDIVMPQSSKEYFEHLDHWQKPLPFIEVLERAGGLIEKLSQ